MQETCKDIPNHEALFYGSDSDWSDTHGFAMSSDEEYIESMQNLLAWYKTNEPPISLNTDSTTSKAPEIPMKSYYKNLEKCVFILKENNILDENIWVMNRCTFEKDFFSYRRDKGLTGRMWAVMALPET